MGPRDQPHLRPQRPSPSAAATSHSGALNTYVPHGADFGDDGHALATVFASSEAVALANAALYGSTLELARNMETAMTSPEQSSNKPKA